MFVCFKDQAIKASYILHFPERTLTGKCVVIHVEPHVLAGTALGGLTCSSLLRRKCPHYFLSSLPTSRVGTVQHTGWTALLRKHTSCLRGGCSLLGRHCAKQLGPGQAKGLLRPETPVPARWPLWSVPPHCTHRALRLAPSGCIATAAAPRNEVSSSQQHRKPQTHLKN